MRLTDFGDFPVTSATTLSAATCAARLQAEFADAQGRWWRARSDPHVLGWPTPQGYTLALAARYAAGVPGLQRVDTTRTLRFRLQAASAGTCAVGVYGYADPVTLLLGVIFGVLFGGLVGAGLLALGLVFLTQRHALTWPLVSGAGILTLGGLALANRRDAGLAAERTYLARYLERVLEAAPS